LSYIVETLIKKENVDDETVHVHNFHFLFRISLRCLFFLTSQLSGEFCSIYHIVTWVFYFGYIFIIISQFCYVYRICLFLRLSIEESQLIHHINTCCSVRSLHFASLCSFYSFYRNLCYLFIPLLNIYLLFPISQSLSNSSHNHIICSSSLTNLPTFTILLMTVSFSVTRLMIG
jgi:hypothetical protein